MTSPEDNCGMTNHRAARMTSNVIKNYFKSKLSRSNTHEGINQKDSSNELITHILHHPSHPALKQRTQPPQTTHKETSTQHHEKTIKSKKSRRRQPRRRHHTELWTLHQTWLTELGFSSNLNNHQGHLGKSWGS